jgi:hypothetical protein
VKEDEIGGVCSTHGTYENCILTLVGKPEGKKPLGRPRRRREDNIRLHVTEIGLESVDWIQLAQDRDQWWDVVNTVRNLRFHKKRGIS